MGPFLRQSLIQWLALVVLMTLVILALPSTDLYGGQAQLLWAAIMVLVAQLLGPLSAPHQQPARTALGQGLAAGLALPCCLLLLTAPAAALSTTLWLLAAGVAILVMLGSLLQQALQLRQRLPAGLAATAVAVTTLTLMLAPLWLGPLARSSESVGVVALFISPLSLLAGLADIDFMRASWFYRYSALASLPFSYPPLVLLLALYGGLMLHTRRICLRSLPPSQPILPETNR
jgi:hypothetical protein